MKKIIRILSLLTLTSLGTLSTVACNWKAIGDDNGGGQLDPGKPENPEPEGKDREYYLTLIAQNESDIEDCKEWLSDINRDKNNDQNNDEPAEDYNLAINEVTAEMYAYQAENYEYYYQIVLVRNEGQIDLIDKQEAIDYLTAKKDLLMKELERKQTIIDNPDNEDEYPEDELDNIQANINATKIVIEKLNAIQEVRNV